MRRALDGNPQITNPHGAAGWGHFGKHLGYDYGARTGTPVFAPVGGTVNMVTSGGSGGTMIQLDGGYWHRFLHLNTVHVRVGQRVTEGQHIADSGATGNVTGPHLHHDVRRAGTAWNAAYEYYVDWEAKLREAAQPTTAGAPVVNSEVVGKTLYLKPTVDKWRVYRIDTQPKVGSELAFLNPAKYGGLSYRINGVSQHAQTVQIQTQMFGNVNIYVDKDAEIR